MEVDTRRRIDADVKDEDDHGDTDLRTAKDKPSYRSFKKKYRKMRIVFDQRMQENENLHKLEQKALATASRLAIEKDRLLDLLLDVNSSGQIPPEKRFDLSLDPPSDADDELEASRPSTPPPRGLKSYKSLLQEVPHTRFASAPEKFPDLLSDLKTGRDSPADPLQGATHPPSFLTAEDIDKYLYELDSRLNLTNDPPLPSLAPRDTSRDFALRNPVSVYNWLRKHAPKTFLQDGEHQDKDADDSHGGPHSTPGAGSGRGGRGGASKGERSGRGGAGGSGTGRNKRAGMSARAAAALPTAGEDDEDTAYEGSGVATPTTSSLKSKRKRTTDDDPGYRPKGGTSRPTKKKRKSEGGGGGGGSGGADGTPTAPAKRPRKSGGDLVMKGADD